MKNFIQRGDVLTITAGADLVSGQGLLVGDLFGVVTVGVASGAKTELHVGGGVFELPKVSAQAWTQGASIYWDDTAKNCTTTTSTHKKIGVAAAVADNPSATGRVLLNATV
jgi:predicted RecA/RadA family phage recombinase